MSIEQNDSFLKGLELLEKFLANYNFLRLSLLDEQIIFWPYLEYFNCVFIEAFIDLRL